MIKFACFSPHPPLLLPDIGSEKDRKKVKKTIESLEYLAKSLKEVNPETIIISSPHPDWGFNVPLYFLAPDFKGKIKTYLTKFEPPEFYFNQGKKVYQELDKDKNYALIASGDLSHCLKEEGPYGFNPDGPKFDKDLIKFLEKKDIENFLKLDETYPEAGECGLRSFSFLLGILEEAEIHPVKSSEAGAKQFSRVNWQAEILSYEAPFGVGYLVVNFKLR